MINFEPGLLRVEYMMLKSCTTALGGSITVVDEEKSTKLLEKYKRIPSPFAVTRAFIKRSQKGSFFYATPVAVTFYGDIIVALEKSPYGNLTHNIETGESIFGDDRWISTSELNINRLVRDTMHDGHTWYIDGSYIFRIDQNAAIEQLTSDGLFQGRTVMAFKLGNLFDPAFKVEQRASLAFCVRGRCVFSPPVWRTIAAIGSSKIDDEDDGFRVLQNSLFAGSQHQFDKIDDLLGVNLSFALAAAKSVSQIFGYDYIEPLNLPDMMIRLNTVNLPNVHKSVKRSVDIGIKFTHVIAWLIGLTERVHTLDSYIVVRDLLKHVTSKGIFRRQNYDVENIFAAGYSLDTVPVLKHDEVAERLKPKLPVEDLVTLLKVA